MKNQAGKTAGILPPLPNPRVLPCQLQVLVRAAETAVTAGAVPNFDGLVFGVRHRDGATDPRTGLLRLAVRYPEYRSDPSPPEVAI